MTDRMAMALTAVELVSGATTHTDEETLALLDGHSMYDMHVLLSSVRVVRVFHGRGAGATDGCHPCRCC